MTSDSRVLQSRYVFPIAGDPLPNGQVVIERGKVQAVGIGLSDEPEDLGNCALLPAFVNAHTHLEFSGLAAPLGNRGNVMTDWIPHVIRARLEDPALANRKRCLEQGIEESMKAGVGLIGDIVNVPFEASAYANEGLQAVLFRELIGLSEDVLEERMQWMKEHLDLATAEPIRLGVSPHAPYTVNVQLLERVCQNSRERGFPVAMHLAESLEELELLQSHSGPFLEMLDQLNAWDPSAIPRGIEPLDYLQILAGAERALVIHGNYLQQHDWEFLAANPHLAVVFCPRTHDFFEHGEYPLQQMLSAGVNIAIGTDSRASNPDLSIHEELKFLFQHSAATPEVLLQLGTRGGAQALGCGSRGTLEPGMDAVFAQISLPQEDEDQPAALVLHEDATARLRDLSQGKAN